METCRTCGFEAPDFTGLAHHMIAQKSGHHAGKKWAAIYLTNVRWLNNKKDKPERVPLSEEDKAAKASTKHELSGIERQVNTICPRCNQNDRLSLPIEYIESNSAWRKGGTLVISCWSCRR
jgi:GTP cyclohydrolase FolE2